ncbi:Cyclin-T1-5 [Apostasia shenzhenica]|uniref:Cyclin-T1-5 n=1 Tax=Apostasia shenzhenica TaxID=1088818 RepID=A0A2I0APL6_9ASPA|nr:Cyclin-T1-5 [Apostasia shenzhenica]
MLISRDYRRGSTVITGAGTATSYPAYAQKHRYRCDAFGFDDGAPPAKRRKPAVLSRGYGRNRYRKEELDGGTYVLPSQYVLRSDGAGSGVICAEWRLHEGAAPIMSRDEIDSSSPSRKDGIDRYMETLLRYSYCAYLQSLGMSLDLPQTTIGTAMVLCHRFFHRRSHASHDRYLISTAALFLAAKSEETPCLLNNLLSASYDICQRQNLSFFPHFPYNQDLFELYRERVINAEQLILTTLNFELEVEHPYAPLTTVLNKLGLSQTVLLNLACNLVNEGLRSSLWLQFKPHHIAAGAACLAAKFLNIDLTYFQNIWQEFRTTAPVIEDVVQQLWELL